jgi:hypothetical protein
MAISVFRNFGFLSPKISKNNFLEKSDPQIQNFKYIKKTGIYVREKLLLIANAKFWSAILNFEGAVVQRPS